MNYRKLPGRRSGFLHGANLWIADDHILAVKSLRFREEYKRFYLRDIQAIVVADRPRFHISTRAAIIAALWLAVSIAAWNRAPWVPAVMLSAATCLVGSWLYVSYFRSCSCRIHTAVSRDVLPSIYRTWIARQFLAEVEPLIWQVQGVLQLTFLTLHSVTKSTVWISYVLTFVQIGGGVAIFLQYHRGILRAGMQRLAIATLILMGISYYVSQILGGVAMGNRPVMPDPSVIAALPSYLLLRQVNAVACLILGLVGVGLILMPEGDTP